MDVTVTASTNEGEWALTDLLGREMGCVAETELGVFRIKPQGQAVTTMGALTSKTYASLDIALAAIEEYSRRMSACMRLPTDGGWRNQNPNGSLAKSKRIPNIAQNSGP